MILFCLQLSGLEDEEDLEALRLAALQSIKKPVILQDNNALQVFAQQKLEQSPQFWQGKGFRHKKGNSFGGRGKRNVRYFNFIV